MKKIIDISQFQTGVDYSAAAEEIDGVIVRIGYRGWGSAGTLCRDTMFDTHMKGIVENKIPYGFYFFSQAVNTDEAIEEANYAAEVIKNYKPTYPVYLDIEESTEGSGNGRADHNSKDTWTAIAKAFCKRIEQLGYTGGIYANEYYFNNKIDLEQIKNYSIWCAKYSSNKPNVSKYDAWQFTSEQKVDGFNSGIDMSYFYTEYSAAAEKKETKKAKKETKVEKKPTYKTYYVNIDEGLNYRKTPNGEYVGTYKDRTALEVEEGSEVSNNGLTWVKLKNGYYVAKKYLTTTKPTVVDLSKNYKVGNVYTLQYDMKVRSGAGTDYAQKTYWQITPDGRRNAYNQNLAVLRTGTKVTAMKVIKISNNEVWLLIPSGYVCAASGKTTYIK